MTRADHQPANLPAHRNFAMSGCNQACGGVPDVLAASPTK
jgi:hypothetical protein